MSRKIKVHYYSVSNNQHRSLDDLLQDLERLPLDQRVKSIRHGDVNLEHIEKHDSLWFLHFTNSRASNWPGVARKGHASTDLNLGFDVELTENTYAAFDTTVGVMVLQYTQSAVRASRLFAYFDQHTEHPNSFFYTPILNDDAMERFERQHTFTTINVAINDVTDADVAYFDGSSVGSAVRESVNAGVTILEMSFRVDARVKGNRIEGGLVRRLVDRMIARNSQNDKLIVKGRDDQNSPVESIDLLADAKTAEYDERGVTLTPGRRYRLADMRTILFDALEN